MADDVQLNWFRELLASALDRRDLDAVQMRHFITEVMTGRCGEMEAAALLVALRMKGETAEELATAAAVLRERMVKLELARDGILDTCGMGGDGSGTFNISTATAFVAAGAGVPVVKHGNRAVSGHTGSADVLAQLGVAVHPDPSFVRRCLDQAGLAFCFAPHFHPALQHVAALRRRLGVRTLFNLLGPLVNPASAPYQLLGVARPELLDRLAGALQKLGTRKAILVSSLDGLDEVSLSAPTQVREVSSKGVREYQWVPSDFGLEPCTLADLRVDGPAASAAVVRAILDGQPGPAARVVLSNAAAALLAAERVATLGEGVALARDTIQAGRARQVLLRLVACSEQLRENESAGHPGPA